MFSEHYSKTTGNLLFRTFYSLRFNLKLHILSISCLYDIEKAIHEKLQPFHSHKPNPFGGHIIIRIKNEAMSTPHACLTPRADAIDKGADEK